MGDSRTVGVSARGRWLWFMGASLISLTLGLLIANLTQPGSSMSIPLPEAGTATQLKTRALNLRDFITQVFPKEHRGVDGQQRHLCRSWCSRCSSAWPWVTYNRAARTLVATLDEVVHVMPQGHRLRDALPLCPVGVGSAQWPVPSPRRAWGCWVFWPEVHAQFYLALAALWLVLVFAG